MATHVAIGNFPHHPPEADRSTIRQGLDRLDLRAHNALRPSERRLPHAEER